MTDVPGGEDLRAHTAGPTMKGHRPGHIVAGHSKDRGEGTRAVSASCLSQSPQTEMELKQDSPSLFQVTHAL